MLDQSTHSNLYVIGGSFDPIHKAHLRVIETLAKQDPTGQILIVPTHHHFYKSHQATFEQRCHMVQLATSHLPQITVSTQEATATGPIETITTLEQLRYQYPRRPIYFICGYDVLQSMDTWPRWRGILKWAHCLVIPRQGPKLSKTMKAFIQQHLSLTWPQTNCGMIVPYFIPLYNMSSTAIRRSLNSHTKHKHVPECILPYINQYKLYR